MKKIIGFFLAAALLSLTACNTSEIEGVVDPETGYYTIPFSISVSSFPTTKVTGTPESEAADASYTYSFTGGDIIQITGATLASPSNLSFTVEDGKYKFSGSLTFTSVPVDGETDLTATLINDPSNTVTAGYYPSTIVQAIQTQSAFKKDFKYQSSTQTLQLEQTKTFVTFNLTFNNNQSDAAIDAVIYNNGIEVTSGKISVSDNSASFTVALDPLIFTNASLKVGDAAAAYIGSTSELLANKRYAVARVVNNDPQLGDAYYSDGTWGSTNNHSGGAAIIGVVVYVNQGSSSIHPSTITSDSEIIDFANGVTEANTKIDGKSVGGRGLVMALNNTASKCTWSSVSGTSSTLVTTPTIALNSFGGYANTLANHSESYPAANAAVNYTPTAPGSSDGCTGWFLPAVGQWMAALYGLGGADNPGSWVNGDNNNWLAQGSISNNVIIKKGSAISAINSSMSSSGVGSTDITTTDYWTSSEYNGEMAIRMNIGGSTSMKVDNKNKNTSYLVRPFLAF